MKDKSGFIDVFEVFDILYTFCEGSFDEKIKEIFILFDFDGSGAIDYSELYLLFQSGILGFCKLLRLPLPNAAQIKMVTDETMEEIGNEAQK